VKWDIIGDIRDIQTIATGVGVKVRRRLRKWYGAGRWRKCKGIAAVRLPDGTIRQAELHWYEASGFGKQELKLKRLLDDNL